MKVYFLSIILAPSSGASVLKSTGDFSTFPFYQRGSITEFMTFTSMTLAERTPLGGRQSIQDTADYAFHVYKRSVPEHLTGKSSVKLTSLGYLITSH